MNAYRSLTAEEYTELSPALEKCNILSPSEVSRFVDTKLNKIYSVYLLNGKPKTVLKQCDPDHCDTLSYDRYFAGKDFAVPQILERFTVDSKPFIRMEFADGPDARCCDEIQGQRIGDALAAIQRHYLTFDSTTEAAMSYFQHQVVRYLDKIQETHQIPTEVLSYVESRFSSAPCTLVHDDLLPINVLLRGEKIWIIDWEYAGIYPYFLDLGRFAFVTDENNQLFIPHESAMAFLRSYYTAMQQNLNFTVSHAQFYLDVAVSAFCQYVVFLSCSEDADSSQAAIDEQYFQEIVAYIQSHMNNFA